MRFDLNVGCHGTDTTVNLRFESLLSRESKDNNETKTMYLPHGPERVEDDVSREDELRRFFRTWIGEDSAASSYTMLFPKRWKQRSGANWSLLYASVVPFRMPMAAASSQSAAGLMALLKALLMRPGISQHLEILGSRYAAVLHVWWPIAGPE